MLAADAAEWAAFVMMMGGVCVKSSERPIHPLYQVDIEFDSETGELLEENLTRYGNPKAPRIIGLATEAGEIITRTKQWTLVSSIMTERASPGSDDPVRFWAAKQPGTPGSERSERTGARAPLDLCQ